ncbi:MAG: cell division protein FtsL [bacterium]
MANRRKKDSSHIYIVYIVMLCVALFFYVWQRAQAAKLSYDITGYKSKVDELRNINKHLQVDIQKLRSLERIEKVASESLHMHKPSKDEVIMLPGVSK